MTLQSYAFREKGKFTAIAVQATGPQETVEVMEGFSQNPMIISWIILDASGERARLR